MVCGIVAAKQSTEQYVAISCYIIISNIVSEHVCA